MERISRLLDSIEQDVRTLRQLLGGAGGVNGSGSYFHPSQGTGDEQAVEGIFNGGQMVDAEGKTYQVSANYASKSKLVEGDPLKLYITPDGKFFYKQLGPIPRITTPGTLRAEGSHYVIDADDGKTYSVLTASVTYYMSLYGLRAGDRVMILLPADRPAVWAVIDNVL